MAIQAGYKWTETLVAELADIGAELVFPTCAAPW